VEAGPDLGVHRILHRTDPQFGMKEALPDVLASRNRFSA